MQRRKGKIYPFKCRFPKNLTSLVAQIVKHLPTTLETWVWSLGWEDPLGKEMALHSSILAWKIPWTEESGRLQSMGSQRVGQEWAAKLNFQRIARRDKKAFLRDQCKEIEEKNRTAKTRDLFKKIRDTKGTFHAKMSTIKDRITIEVHIYKIIRESVDLPAELWLVGWRQFSLNLKGRGDLI